MTDGLFLLSTRSRQVHSGHGEKRGAHMCLRSVVSVVRVVVSLAFDR